MPERNSQHQKLWPVGLSVGETGLIPGNRISLLQNGEAYFPAIERAFDRARHDIYLETYISCRDLLSVMH